MNTPEGLRYSDDHQWAIAEGDRVKIGITDYAQDALGEVVFIEVPDVGAAVTAGESFGEIESTKSVSDLYSPVDGTVVEANTALGEQPETVNEDPYGAGWICVIETPDPGALDNLMDADAYIALIGEE